ncbi:MAG: hypothetical protein IT384_15900 [Deltaproteobacteria bacterium]|nr:hypothetical protein [Deltaproteobacteria bacterium]
MLRRLLIIALSLSSPHVVFAQPLGVLGQQGNVSVTKVRDLPPTPAGTLLDSDGNSYGVNGSLVCSGPGTGGATRYYLDPGANPGQKFAAAEPASGGVRLLIWNTGQSGGAPRISMFRVRCGQNEELLGSLDLTASTFPSNTTDPYGFFDVYTLIDARGRLCTPNSDGIACFAAGNPLDVERTIRASELRAQLVPASVMWSSLFPEISPTASEVALRFGVMAGSADGSLYSIFEIELGDGAQIALIRYLVERMAAGTVALRYGPEALVRTGPSPTNTEVRKALSRVSALAVDESTQTLFAFPRSGRRLIMPRWMSHPIFDGLGAATWPLHAVSGEDGTRVGHLELSQVFQQSLGNPGNPTQVAMKTSASGRVLFTAATGEYQLAYEPDAIDMDEDGLSASEERTLGSSDYAGDSDGGGLRDGIEARVYRTNPSLASDDADRLRRHTTDVEYAYSPLIRERLDVETHRQTWSSNFLCGGGSCWDRSGRQVLTGAGTNGPFMTEDGTHAIANFSGTEIRRYDVRSGSHEMVARTGDITTLLPTGANLEPIPGKGQRVYLVGDKRVVAFGDAPPQVVFDLSAEECRSKLGACGPASIDSTLYGEDVYTNLLPLGFDPVIDRLLVLAVGHMDQVVLGVASGQAPVVLARGNELPEYMIDTGGGIYPTASVPEVMTPLATGELWATYEGSVGFVDGDYSAYDGPNMPFLSGLPGRGFDDSLFVNATGGPTPRGLFELVRMDGRIEPGDVMSFSGPNSIDPGTFQPSRTRTGPYLYRVGRRGGVSPLFDTYGAPGSFADFGAVRGMRVSVDGRICAAGMDGKLHELIDPDPITKVPARYNTYTSVQGATDCLYDDDGKLHVLIDSPPGIFIFDSRDQEPGALYAITGVSTPTRFVLGADGMYRIADAAGPLACAGIQSGMLSTGSISAAGLTLGKDGALYVLERPSGALLRVDATAACTPAGVPTPLGVDAMMLYTHAAKPVFPWIVANLVERPDGQFMIMPARSRLLPYDPSLPIDEPMYLFYFDPRDRSFEVSPHDFGFAGTGSALALVPGGAWNDPWGEAGSSGSPDAGVGSGPDGGGSAGGGGGGGDEGGCGCSSTPARRAPRSLAWLLGLGLGWWRARPRGPWRQPNPR